MSEAPEPTMTFPEVRDACGVSQSDFARYMRRETAAKAIYGMLREEGKPDDVARAGVLRLMVGETTFHFAVAMVVQRKKQETSSE